MDRRYFLAALTAAPFLPCVSIAATPADLRGDIDILRRVLKMHPGLYRYNSPDQIDREIAALARTFVAAQTHSARYLTLSRFLATIRCGHSYANFFNQKRAIAEDLFDRPTRLPFNFRWIGRRMIVTSDPSKVDMLPGTEVTTVNGIAAGEILTALMPYARADGSNDAKRMSLLGVSGSDSIEYFDVFHGLLFGAPPGGEHHVTIRLPDGRTDARRLPAIDLTSRQSQMAKLDYRNGQPVWTFKKRADGISVLTMPSWALYDGKWDWQSWLGDRLDQVDGDRGLIVDLRQNEGGEDCGDALLARLIDRPIVEPHAERRLRFQRTAADLDSYLDTWDQSFRSLGANARPIDDGFFLQTGEKADDSIQPSGRRLTLPVAALIGPVNSSATFQFAAKARLSGRIRLFGETTGGNLRGINGGCFFFVRLPASGLEFDLPLIGYFPGGRAPDAGLAPDVYVAQTALDIAAGRDPAMTSAVDWILQS